MRTNETGPDDPAHFIWRARLARVQAELERARLLYAETGDDFFRRDILYYRAVRRLATFYAAFFGW